MVLSDSQKWLVIFILSSFALLLYAPQISFNAVPSRFRFSLSVGPLVDRLDKIFGKRVVSVFVVFLILFVMASVSLLLLIPVLGDQLKNLLINTPRVIYWLQSYFGPWISGFTNQEYSYVDIETLRASVLNNWTQIASYLKKFLRVSWFRALFLRLTSLLAAGSSSHVLSSSRLGCFAFNLRHRFLEESNPEWLK